MDKKICTNCGILQSINEYRIINGYIQSHCNNCIRERVRAYYQNNRG